MKGILIFLVLAGIFFFNVGESWYCKKCNFKTDTTTKICNGCNEKTEWSENRLNSDELKKSQKFLAQEADLVFEKGVKAIKANKMSEAEKNFSKVEKSSDKYEMAQKYLAEIKKKENKKDEKNYFKEGKEYKKADRYKEALEAFEKVKWGDSEYKEAQKEIKEIKDNLLYDDAVEMSYEELTRNVKGNIGKGVLIYGIIRDIQENDEKSIVSIDMYNEITERETESVIIKIEKKLINNIGDSVNVVGIVESEFQNNKSSLATWFGRGYTIYTNAEAKKDRIPIIRAIEFN